MFGWDFAKSAETVFSRWAVKRICKFVLKKKLGDYILGDIDLNQVDVQLRQGTIQLSDLALNVDFINLKLREASIIVKEGSIASLSITIPWKMKNCQINIEELELVIASSTESNQTPSGLCLHSEDVKPNDDSFSKKVQNGESTSTSVSLDVHEGVKTIAKIVKLFLTTFHVRLKNLIVAFDPGSEIDGKNSKISRHLVFRIAETEYGTCISEDYTAKPNSKIPCLLGMTKLTNFIKFRGAVIEFLEMNDNSSDSQLSSSPGRSFVELSSNSSTSGCTARILSGADGGFAGVLNLSIPWKNGCLDVHKLEADISIDPLVLSLRPSTLMWLIAIWECVKDAPKDCPSNNCYMPTDSVHTDHMYHGHSSATCSSVVAEEVSPKSMGSLSPVTCSPYGQEIEPDVLLPGAHVIHNWVHFDQSELDSDYGASIDHFFECFDGMRNSHASAWNWTCSVFSAITAASSLASECGHIPADQHNVETNIKASISSISVIISLQDEYNSSYQLAGNDLQLKDMSGTEYRSLYSSSMIDSLLNDPSSETYRSCMSFADVDQFHHAKFSIQDMNCLNATCLDLSLILQSSSQHSNFQLVVKHLKVDGQTHREPSATELTSLNPPNSFQCQSFPVENLQSVIQDVLPPLSFRTSESEDRLSTSSTANLSQCVNSLDNKMQGSSYELNHHTKLVKVSLLKSFGECFIEYSVSSSTDSSPKSSPVASFSVALPPFILWIDFHLVKLLNDFFEQVGSLFARSSISRDCESDITKERTDFSTDKVVKEDHQTAVSPPHSGEDLHGKIVFPNARIIFCFTSENNRGTSQVLYWDKFISLELSSPHPPLRCKNTADYIPVSTANSSRSSSYPVATSICLDFGNVDVYFVTSSNDNASETVSQLTTKELFSAIKVLSLTIGTNHHYPMITMIWQRGSVTGPWMAKRVWNSAVLHDPSSKNKSTSKEFQFASAKTAEGIIEANCHLRQEILLTSTFLLHVRLSLVCASLSHHEYTLLHHLVNQVTCMLGQTPQNCTTTDRNKKKDHSIADDSNMQASILVECDALDLCITTDEFEEISSSMQKELPGCWNKLRLKVVKFELISASNIGGVSGANYFWLGHGEGDLWGSIVNVNNRTQAATQEFLLITCKDSAVRRGDGEGGNVMSFGTAGICIRHHCNPQLLQNSTSLTVRCATVIAPGFRLDWFNTMFQYFRLPPYDGEANDVHTQEGTSEGTAVGNTFFFLDLVDVAFSYEPQFIGAMALDSECCSAYSDKAHNQKYISCLLAASSLSLSNQTKANHGYNIYLQDVGLLISQLSKFKIERGYDVDHLRDSGYVKIAGDALVSCAVKTNIQDGPLWEVDFSETHVKLDTCGDTTLGLVCLVTQLQQLFAPDLEDALVHLQSRWNATKESQDILDKSAILGNREVVSDSKGPRGLMDEIQDDFFDLQGRQISQSDICAMQPGFSDNQAVIMNEADFNLGHVTATSDHFSNESYDGAAQSIKTESLLNSNPERISSPELIESYYMVELLPQSKSPISSHSSIEPLRQEANETSNRGSEGAKDGWYNSNLFVMDENHIPNVNNSRTDEQSYYGDDFFESESFSSYTCKPRGRIVLKDIDITWRMFGGCDWPESIEFSSCSTSLGRDKNACLELQLFGLNVQYAIYPEQETFVSKLSLDVKGFQLYDRSWDAPWKMILGYYQSKQHGRESCAKALKLDLEAVRPDPLTPLEEYRLRIACLPMRLHLDQRQLNFLIKFFVGKTSNGEYPDQLNDLSVQGSTESAREDFEQETIAEEALLPFFQKCDIWPIIVCVDYVPRHVDLAALRGGNFIQLINLVPWKGIDLQLKHVSAIGIYGWGGICEAIFGEWLEDISQNQVHKVLKGLKPIRSLFSVSAGAAKLVSLPIKDYKRDRRLIKGIQRGAVTFLRSISLEAVGLGLHVAAGAHDILFQTECALASIPSPLPVYRKHRAKASVRSNQPKDARHGMRQAYESLSDGLSRTASALVGTPLKTYQRGAGAGSALASAIRAAPGAAVAPATAAARAVHCALLGVRNSLDPEHHKESMEKYMGSSATEDRGS